jgi:putative SOS response-associated peptidase YedK
VSEQTLEVFGHRIFYGAWQRERLDNEFTTGISAMCGGMSYQYVDPETGEIKTRKVYFPIPQAKIPVIEEETETISLCQWGRRHGEDENFDVPITGWARLLSLKEGKWNQYQPTKVKIPATAWMEKDADRQSHWFDMDDGQAILGVRIEQRGKAFVYVVTRPAEGAMSAIHERMPMLVSSPNFKPQHKKSTVLSSKVPVQMRLGVE